MFRTTLLLIAGVLLVAPSAAEPRPSADMWVASPLLPESKQEFVLAWHDATRIELEAKAVDLNDDPWALLQPEFGGRRGPIVRCITYDTHTGEHRGGGAVLSFEPPLPPGAYLISGKAYGLEPGAMPGFIRGVLLLVTDAHILVQSTATAAKIFVSDVETGEPIANARVRI
ncbi:MAG TPA: hypothetical protein VE010_00795, partial [Thermoanaerobaculia bacterium]|nr:hypothetical protein [Thermoanaerobaculia bacterium]